MKNATSVTFLYFTGQCSSRWPETMRCVITSIITLCFLIVSVNSNAQFTKLMDFTTATSGRNLAGNLVTDGTFLYGMAVAGGINDVGTIFKIKPDGTDYLKLLNFEYTTKGSYPLSSLTFDGTFLYGTTSEGGTSGGGTIFKINPDGSGFVKLLDFNGAVNGVHPAGTLLSDGTFLYGTTEDGGTNGLGTLFKIKSDGTGFTKLLDFESVTTGRNPKGDLISDGTYLYGMTIGGGVNNRGTIFKLKVDGTGFVKLLDFAGASNGNGGFGSLISDGTFLYGMTAYGGSNNMGIIFKIKPDGTDFVKLLDFAGTTNGNDPRGSLIFDGTVLYGMTGAGGANGLGIIFKINPDGSGFSNLFDFSILNGAYPKGSLLSEGAFLYGMTDYGGTNGAGIIFKFSPSTIALPAITSFMPSSGPIGTTVIITGTNFSSFPAANTVRFNGTMAAVTASSATSITATVPVGATTGTITVTVDGNTATSANSFMVTGGAVITFVTQPVNSILCDGDNTTFTVAAIGDTNLKYQWQSNVSGFVNLSNSALYSGVNTASLVITNAPTSLNGMSYRCIVQGDNSGNTPSGNAVLTVNAMPIAEITPNGTKLVASNGEDYQWYQNGVAISGAINQVFELIDVFEYGVYAVEVTDNGCTAMSNNFVYLVTGIEQQRYNWEVYPNPFIKTLSIKGVSQEKIEIEIVDVLGRLVKRISEFDSNTISLEELTEGSYFLNIHSAKQNAHFRITKEHE